MVAESSGARRTRVRECVCCGEATATPSIPACWDDWNVFPEDLRSSIVKNYGRRLIKEYTDDLLVAVAFWANCVVDTTSPKCCGIHVSEGR